MIPRLHPRGTSFKGACSYILHDAGQTSAERVEWTLSRNLGSPDIRDAWFEMMRTWRDRGVLKEAAGVDARGRDNWKPVLHYTLSWHADDKPTPDHMQQAALDSLKALGLSEHQAVLAAHNDKQHMHVHIVVNTVHPETGKTAALKFTKRDLSKWAEAYEREHGVRCEERIKNNEERSRLAAERDKEALAILTAAANREPLPKRRPYVPVKHRASHRQQWLDRNEIIDRMKSMRAALDAELKTDREATWKRHTFERNLLDHRTESAIDHARAGMKERFRPEWRELYRFQKKEQGHVRRTAGNLLERAVFVFRNRARLGVANAALTTRQMLPLIASGKRLTKRLAQAHEQERRGMARRQRAEIRLLTDALWQRHRAQFSVLRDRQAAERQTERQQQAVGRKSISFALAKAALIQEREAAPQPEPAPRPIKRDAQHAPLHDKFAGAAKADKPAKLSRSEQIRRDMEEWRKRNEGKDFGREM